MGMPLSSRRRGGSHVRRVRSKKKVKPIYFTRLPKDLNEIKSVNEKKETFLQILLPLIVAENEKIIEDRKYLLKILKKNESEKSKKWLNTKYIMEQHHAFLTTRGH